MSEDFSYIKQNIDEIKKEIAMAANKSGKNPEDILLLAVSKTIDVQRIKVAVEYGLTCLGENRVQEILEKYDEFGDTVKWHLIGHLQTNKVKYIIDKVALIHSVESLKLAQEIDRRAKAIDKVMDILVEVNIAKEDSKFGIFEENVEEFITQLSQFENISVKGLMTVAPFVENPQNNRIYFEKMTKLMVDINAKKINNVNMNILSMGMSGDYQVAIEEGANIIRVGTGIFGKRIYK